MVAFFRWRQCFGATTVVVFSVETVFRCIGCFGVSVVCCGCVSKGWFRLVVSRLFTGKDGLRGVRVCRWRSGVEGVAVFWFVGGGFFGVVPVCGSGLRSSLESAIIRAKAAS